MNFTSKVLPHHYLHPILPSLIQRYQKHPCQLVFSQMDFGITLLLWKFITLHLFIKGALSPVEFILRREIGPISTQGPGQFKYSELDYIHISMDHIGHVDIELDKIRCENFRLDSLGIFLGLKQKEIQRKIWTLLGSPNF